MLRKRTILHALRAFTASAAACIATALAAAPASAGEYIVPFCNQSVTGTTNGTWTHSNTGGGAGNFWDGNNCSPYAGYYYRRFEVWTIPAGASDDWTFDAPAGTYISRLEMYQSAGPRSSGSGDAIYAWQQDGSRSTVAAASPGQILSDRSYAFSLSGSKVIKLRSSMYCESGASCAGTTQGYYGNEDYFSGALVHVVDPTLPAFGSVSGEGWKDAPSDGSDPIDYAVTDAGAGVKSVRFLLDGVLQTQRTASCDYDQLVPCPGSLNGTFTLDTTRLSEGAHEVKLITADGAANENTASKTITVRRPPQPVTSPGGSGPVSTSNPGAGSAGGAPAVGDQLTGNQGSWTGTGLTFTYQWMRCDASGANCAPIPGATAATYTAGAADVGHALQFCVTATNSGGSSTSCSTPTPAVVASHPSNANTSDRPGDPVPASPAPSQKGSSVTTGETATTDRGHANGEPAADKVVLSAVTNNRTSTQKVKFGKRVPISGRLLGMDGKPISGAVLAVQVQTAVPGASMADAAQVVTGRDGRFTYVAPAGPSRTLRFGYRSYSADASFADTTDVRLLVTAGVTMKAKPTTVHNRHATLFTGRLLGKPIPKRGVVIDLQVFFRKHWRTFAAPRTKKNGAYKYRYRFMAGAATWRFRAQVRTDSSYPFTLGRSLKPVRVKVLP